MAKFKHPRRSKDGTILYTIEPKLTVDDIPLSFRADLIFKGVDPRAPSYEARVFFNVMSPNKDTPKDDTSGYAGSFHIFGHLGCYGDTGHCDPPTRPRNIYDLRPEHPLRPIEKMVVVTDALVKAITSVKNELAFVAVVPVMWVGTRVDAAGPNVLKFEKIELHLYELAPGVIR